MKVIVRFPETEESKKLLNDRINEIQANTVISYINDLNCSDTQKKMLFDYLSKKANQMVENGG